MEKPAQRYSQTQQVHFSAEKRARLIISPPDTDPTELISALTIPPFQTLFIIAGGAAEMDEQLSRPLTQLFTEMVHYFATRFSLLIIDGGTQAGIMQVMGNAAAQAKNVSLLGIAPACLVRYPEKVAAQEKEVPLDPHHSHFVLVESDAWGDETALMYRLAYTLSQGKPALAFLVNGGSIARKEVLQNVRQGRPIIVLEGSGRVADEIAQLWHKRPATIPDPELAEIIQDGYIYPFPLDGKTTDFIGLIQELLTDPFYHH